MRYYNQITFLALLLFFYACAKAPVMIGDADKGKKDTDTLTVTDTSRHLPRDEPVKITGFNLDSLRMLADSLYAAGQPELAMPLWMKIIQQAQGNRALLAEAHYAMGNIFFHQTEYAKAEIEFKLALREDSLMTDAYKDLGLVYVIKGDYDKALSVFRRALEVLPGDSESVAWLEYTLGVQAYEKGLEHFNYGFYDPAIEQLTLAARYLDQDTSYNHLIYFMLGKSHYEKLEYDTAEKYLERSLALKPNEASVYTELGNIFFARRDFRKAMEMNRKAISLKPDFAKAYNNLGYIYMTMGNEKAVQKKRREADEDYRQAVILIEKALALDPSLEGARRNLDHLRRILSGKRDITAYTMFQNATKLENNQERIRVFRSIITNDPTYDDAYNNLGVAYFYEGYTDSAITALEQAITINPYNPQAHNNLGYMLGTAHRFDEAMKHLFIAIQIKPDYLDAYVNLGYVYMWKQDFQNSRKIWLTLLRLNPKYREAKRGLEELQRREEAARTGETYLRVEFESADEDSVETKKGY